MPCWGPVEARGLASPLPSLPTRWPSRYTFVAMGNLYMLPLPSIREDSGLSSPLKLPRLSPWINPRLAFSFYSQTGIISLYDCVFKRDPGYNQNLHRDDREHAKGLGLHVNEEVTARGCRRVWTDPLCACLFTFEFSCTKLSCLPIPGRDDQAAVSVPRFCPVKLFIFVTVQSCESESVKSYPILCNPMDCSLPGSSVHGILHSLEWVAIPFSRGSSQPRDWTWVSCIADRCFTVQATREAQPSPIEFNNSMTAKLRSSFRQVNRSLLDLWGLVSRFQGPWPPGNESTWTREIISPELLGRYMHHIWLSSSIIWIVFWKQLTGWVVTNQGNQTSSVRRSGSQADAWVEGRRRRLCVPLAGPGPSAHWVDPTSTPEHCLCKIWHEDSMFIKIHMLH